MAAINIDKFVRDLISKYPSDDIGRIRIEDALKEQGLMYSHGEIVNDYSPKARYKQGDCITNGEEILYIEDNYKDTPYYHVDSIDGVVTYTKDYIENNFHLWTIMDAKDGDFIKYCAVDGNDKKNNFIFIFKEFLTDDFLNRTSISAYAYWAECTDNVTIGSYNFINTGSKNRFSPASYEEMNLLLEKLQRDGYKWNSETKAIEDLYTQFGNETAEKSWKFLENCIEDCMARFLETWDDDAKKETKRKFIKFLNEH